MWVTIAVENYEIKKKEHRAHLCQCTASARPFRRLVRLRTSLRHLGSSTVGTGIRTVLESLCPTRERGTG